MNLKLVVGDTTTEVPWSMMERWSRVVRFFKDDNPDTDTMNLSNSICNGAAIQAFVRLGLRYHDREDGFPMNDDDVLGALQVAHVLDGTLEWFMSANERLQRACTRALTTANSLAWLDAFARDIKIARFVPDRILGAWEMVAYEADPGTAWNIMSVVLDALSTDAKVSRDVAAIALGYIPYVVASIRADRFEPIPRYNPTIRRGTILHALHFELMKVKWNHPDRMRNFLIGEVKAGNDHVLANTLRFLGCDSWNGTHEDAIRELVNTIEWTNTGARQTTSGPYKIKFV